MNGPLTQEQRPTGSHIHILHLVLTLLLFFPEQDSSETRCHVYLHLLRPTSGRWLSIVIASLTTRLTGTWTNWTSTTSRRSGTWSNDKRCRTWSSIRGWTCWVPPTFFPSIAAYIDFILGSTITTGRRSIGTDFIQIWCILGADVFGLSSGRSTSRSW